MISLFIVVFVSILINECMGQCSKDNPFYMIDKGCTSFEDVCVKKDSDPCKSILQACAQCPTSNLTESALINMMLILKDRRNTTTEEHNALLNKLNNLHFTIVISILLLLIEIRFKMLKRCCGKSNKSKPQFITSPEEKPMMKDSIIHEPLGEAFVDIKTSKNCFTSSLTEASRPAIHRNDAIETKSPMEMTVNVKIDKSTNPIKIQINRDDNVVKVKQKICAKMVNTKSCQFKIMELKRNGKCLDDNQYLADKISSVEDSLHCDVIENLDPNGIVVLMLRGTARLPEMIQINKSQPIEDLKRFLSQQINVAVENLKLFGDSKEIDKLDDLKDYDSIRIVEMRMVQITIESIFDHSFTITYSNVDSVRKIINELAKVSGSLANNIILFCDKKPLNDNVFVFEMSNEQEQDIQFCNMISLDKVKSLRAMKNADYSDIYEGQYSNADVVLKKYQLEPMKILKENKALLNSLKSFQITKSHGGFVHLNGVFREKDCFYISMEKMEGSIKAYIENNPPLLEGTIAKWAKQILSALKYLHDRGIIHGNIKPSNIFLDKDGKIRLSSFGFGKYFDPVQKKFIIEGLKQLGSSTYRYLAPEVCNDGTCDAKSDVWSFGATMIEIATGKAPFAEIKNETKAGTEIGLRKEIPYERDKKRSPKLKDFIEQCLIPTPRLRKTVQELLEHDFLNPQR